MAKSKVVSVEDLIQVCMRSYAQQVLHHKVFNRRHKHDYDEVYKHIYISTEDFAKDPECLQSVGITHVLNVGQGKSFMHSDTSEETYIGTGITYKGIKANDAFTYDLSQHFDECIQFVHECLAQGGKVLVHCLQGYSRSPTIVAAYLMKTKGMDAKQALETIRSKREVFPNDGFLKILVDYDHQLRLANNL